MCGEYPALAQHSRLVPPDMFVVQPVAADIYHSDHGNSELFPSRWDLRKKPVDGAVMRYVEDEFVDNAVRADRAGDELQPSVDWVGKDEVVSIELGEGLSSYPTCHRRDVIHIGFSHHCPHRLGHAPFFKLEVTMFIPYFLQIEARPTQVLAQEDKCPRMR